VGAAYETLLIDDPAPYVRRVVLNRPERANAFNTAMMTELAAVWADVAAQPDAVRCVVLTGAGERAFCAGADLKERQGMSQADWAAQHDIFERAAYALMDCPVPVIAAVNGAAYAGGCELVLACDFAFAAASARFALTETTLGIIPGIGGTQNLPRAVGMRRAKQIILSGAPFSAEEAFAWGLVNRLCEPDALMTETIETAARIAGNAPLAVRAAKRAMNASLSGDLKSGLAVEVEVYNTLIDTDDRREGIDAFNEKRPPVFKGR